LASATKWVTEVADLHALIVAITAGARVAGEVPVGLTGYASTAGSG
jgi:hypothetical protein